MKTKTAIVTLLTMLLLIASPSMLSYAAEQLDFTINSVESAKQGDTVNVAVGVDMAGLTDGKAIVTYDSSKMTYQGGKLAYCSDEGKLEFEVNALENGKLVIAWATVDPVERAGEIISLDFKVNDSVANNDIAKVSLEGKYANDKSGVAIPIKADSNKAINIKIGSSSGQGSNDNTGNTGNNGNTGSSDKNNNSDVKTGDSSLIGFGLVLIVSLIALAALKKYSAGRDRA